MARTKQDAKKCRFNARIKWHLEHQANCNCRPIPKKLADEMKKKGVSL